MPKVWIFRETGEVRNPKEGEWFGMDYGAGEIGSIQKSEISFEMSCLPILALESFDHDPLSVAREKLESITCLCAEGPEVTRRADLIQAILKEALTAIKSIEGRD